MVLVSFSKVRIPENISLPPEVKGADFNAKICWFLINESKFTTFRLRFD